MIGRYNLLRGLLGLGLLSVIVGTTPAQMPALQPVAPQPMVPQPQPGQPSGPAQRS